MLQLKSLRRRFHAKFYAHSFDRPAGCADAGVGAAAGTLAKVRQIKTKDRILPEFTREITALNDKEVKLQGFMMPLEPGEKQKHFLISVNPQSCAFCLPAGPEGVVEVKTKTPVKYTFEPVILSGRMSVLKDDPMGLYYRLSDATPSSAK
jgi:hypothetical protein